MRKSKYEKILSLAPKLIAKEGYDGTSFQEIANEVGLHKSSLFHYFKNKEELLLKILQKPIDEVNSNLRKIINNKKLEPEEKFKMAVHNHLKLLTEYIDNVNIYLNEIRSLSRKNQLIYLGKRKRYAKDFMEIVKEMKAKRYFDGLNTKIVTFGLLGMLNWTVKWYKKDGNLNVETIANIFCEMILGLRKA
jgi:AcrR family transcriptional regulator